MAICSFIPGFPLAGLAGFACHAPVLCAILVRWGSFTDCRTCRAQHGARGGARFGGRGTCGRGVAVLNAGGGDKHGQQQAG